MNPNQFMHQTRHLDGRSVEHSVTFYSSSVGRVSAWSHTVSGGMIAPGFESHQCLAGMWKRRLDCHAGRQEVSRCHTRGESQGMCNITRTPPLSSNKPEPTLTLKPRGDVTRSPKQGYQWPHKKHSCPPKIKKKKLFTVWSRKTSRDHPNDVSDA